MSSSTTKPEDSTIGKSVKRTDPTATNENSSTTGTLTTTPRLQQPQAELPNAVQTNKKVITIDTREQFVDIVNNAGDRLIMVEFYAQWCGPCKLLGIKLEELAELYKEKVIIVKIDVDSLEELAIEHDVTNMPAFMIMKNKEKVEQFSGSKVELLENALEKYLGKPK